MFGTSIMQERNLTMAAINYTDENTDDVIELSLMYVLRVKMKLG